MHEKTPVRVHAGTSSPARLYGEKKEEKTETQTFVVQNVQRGGRALAPLNREVLQVVEAAEKTLAQLRHLGQLASGARHDARPVGRRERSKENHQEGEHFAKLRSGPGTG